MTKAQFTKKANVAFEKGMAFMPDGAKLVHHGNMEFAVYDKNGNCVEVSKNGANKLAYLFI